MVPIAQYDSFDKMSECAYVLISTGQSLNVFNTPSQYKCTREAFELILRLTPSLEKETQQYMLIFY